MLNMGQQARIALDFGGAENEDSRLILEVVCSLCTHVRSRMGQRDLHMAQLHSHRVWDARGMMPGWLFHLRQDNVAPLIASMAPCCSRFAGVLLYLSSARVPS